MASRAVLYRKIIDYSITAGGRDLAGTYSFSGPCIRLTEFDKAIGRGQGQEAGPTF